MEHIQCGEKFHSNPAPKQEALNNLRWLFTAASIEIVNKCVPALYFFMNCSATHVTGNGFSAAVPQCRNEMWDEFANGTSAIH
jgi:hypothetical protein